jgi:Protein of unknown function (DUF4031)
VAVYVDDANIPARVPHGRVVHDCRCSHLFADTQQELHAFAAKLCLRRAYFQPGRPRRDGSPSPHWHYDLTAGKRQQAIRLGAQPVTAREAIEIIAAREARAERARVADQASHIAGLAYRAGEFAKASRWLAVARAADPSRARLWAERAARVHAAAREQAAKVSGPADGRSLDEIVTARLQAAGIGAGDYALQFTRAWNAQRFAAAKQRQPDPGDGPHGAGSEPPPGPGDGTQREARS